MKKTTTGVLPVSEDMDTSGLVELTPELAIEMKQKKLDEDIAAVKQELPDAIKAKMEAEGGLTVEELVKQGLLPESALEKASGKILEDNPPVAHTQEPVEETQEEAYPEETARGTYGNAKKVANDEWVSSYGFEDDESEVVKPVKQTSLLDYAVVTAANGDSVFTAYVHDRPVVTKVEQKKLDKITDPKAFEAFLAKKKKMYRDKVSMPLVNSGIVVDIIGCGAFDYSEVYAINPDEESITDILNRMRVMSNNIIDAQPRILPTKILETISYLDYKLAMLAFVAATNPKIKMPSTCMEATCKEEVILEAETLNLLLNGDELNAAWDKIKDLPENERASIKRVQSTLNEGLIVINFESPSLKKVKDTLSAIDSAIASGIVPEDINQFANILMNIADIAIDDSTIDSPIFIYKFLKTLSNEESYVIRDGVDKLYEGVIVPKFGIKFVCPKCGKTNELNMESIDEIAFFHILVSRMLEREMFQKKNTTDGQ